MSVSPITDPRNRQTPAAQNKRKKSKVWLWVTLPLLVVLLLVATVVAIAAMLMPNVMTAKDALEATMPLANKAKQQLLEGDSAAAQETISGITALTSEARQATNDDLWRNLEWVPVAGANLEAVRVASETVDELVTDVLLPASKIDLGILKPIDGAFNIAGLREARSNLDGVQESLDDATSALSDLNTGSLLPQVADGVQKLADALAQLEEVIEPAIVALDVVPGLLGGDGSRNYLLLFQNNAESRGTGGNPAAIMVVNATDGRIDITQQASSSDFKNGRPYTVTDIDAQTIALYGDKIGRWMQDVTLTPDFSEISRIITAFWNDSFDVAVDGVGSFDPVALSYLLNATGPVTISTGETLTAENAVSFLLNQVYFDYPDNLTQDAIFAETASAIFDALTAGDTDIKLLIEALARAVDEGRLMYTPLSEAEAAFLQGSRITGILPADNSAETVLGVYVNDITEGKLDYYLQLDIDAASNQCEVDDPEFVTTATLTNVLTQEEAYNLATYIAPARFFAKGDISTDLVFYGPVGGSFVDAAVDGSWGAGVSYIGSHLGRPVVKVNVLNQPSQVRSVAVKFSGDPDATEQYGDLQVWHTPMVRQENVNLTTPGC